MSQNNEPKTRRTFTPEFKQQIVDLYRSGKRKCDIIVNTVLPAHSLINGYPRQQTPKGTDEYTSGSQILFF